MLGSGEWSAADDEPLLCECVHECRVLGERGLGGDPVPVGPRRSCFSDDGEVAHAPLLNRLGLSGSGTRSVAGSRRRGVGAGASRATIASLTASSWSVPTRTAIPAGATSARRSVSASAYSIGPCGVERALGLKPWPGWRCPRVRRARSSRTRGAPAGRGGMNGLMTSFIASRSFRSCGPQTANHHRRPGLRDAAGLAQCRDDVVGEEERVAARDQIERVVVVGERVALVSL